MKHSSQRFLYIDISRVIAMLWIVGWWHLIQYSGSNYQKYSFPGDNAITLLMLGLFMFLSGYLLGKKQLNTWPEIKSFYLSRFWRFYLLFALSALTFPLTGYNRDVSVMATTLTASSSFILPQPTTLWFMSMLASFYLMTPLIKKNYVIGGGILLIMIILNYILPKGVDERLFIYYPLYSLGIYLAPVGIVERMTKKKWVAFISLIIALTIFYSALTYDWLQYLFIVPGIVFVLSFACMIENSVKLPFISYLSYASLCAYLFHRQIYFVIGYLSDKLIGGTSLLICLCIMLPLCLVISYIIQKVYDTLLLKIQSNGK